MFFLFIILSITPMDMRERSPEIPSYFLTFTALMVNTNSSQSETKEGEHNHYLEMLLFQASVVVPRVNDTVSLLIRL
jgi:hypothetical protein